MTDPQTLRSGSPRWLHWWSVLTLLVGFPLIFLGAWVTTTQSGMVDPKWPTSPWYLLQVPWFDSGIAFLVEHGHRVFGFALGTCAIVLVIGLWLGEPRRWLCWLGTAALACICIQGVLGGFRVLFNALLGRDLAMIHGVFGELVFALLGSLVLCTSRRWSAGAAEVPPEDAISLRRSTLLLTVLMLLQLLLGAFVRHRGLALAQRGHMLVAFAIVGTVVWLARLAWDNHRSDRRVVGLVCLLGLLIVVQLVLGVEAWILKFATLPVRAPGHWLFGPNLARTAHVLVGAGILATGVALAVEAHRQVVALPSPDLATEPARQLEGVA